MLLTSRRSRSGRESRATSVATDASLASDDEDDTAIFFVGGMRGEREWQRAARSKARSGSTGCGEGAGARALDSVPPEL